ncbi:hypothetical protein CAEBREN_22807 [Caenorhabditis brenneri]|uniref:Uncharacterized protein n=1 Tax=Caenorhabditis brenneri TaxID=135651 RepID=G0MSG3_CAEBE|nr:hypothetical protein CAEBREN_22807 [Caenorhabditis brenneri]
MYQLSNPCEVGEHESVNEEVNKLLDHLINLVSNKEESLKLLDTNENELIVEQLTRSESAQSSRQSSPNRKRRDRSFDDAPINSAKRRPTATAVVTTASPIFLANCEKSTGETSSSSPVITTTTASMELSRLLQMTLRGQVLRQVSRDKVLQLKTLPVTKLFGMEVQAKPILLTCPEFPNKAIVAEANHRIMCARDRKLSEEHQKMRVDYIQHTCSKEMFEKSWHLSHSLQYDLCFGQGRRQGPLPRFAEFPLVLQELFLKVATGTAQLEQSLFSSFEEYTLQSAYFQSNIDEVSKERFQKSVLQRNSFFDSLASKGLVPVRSASERETVSFYVYLMPIKTKLQAMEALKTDSLPKTKKCHISIFNAALASDLKTSELLSKYLKPTTKSKMTQDSLLVQLEVIAKTREISNAKASKHCVLNEQTTDSSIAIESSTMDEQHIPDTIQSTVPISERNLPTVLNSLFAKGDTSDDSCQRGHGVPDQSTVLAHIGNAVNIVEKFEEIPKRSVFFCIGICPSVDELNFSETTVICALPTQHTQAQFAKLANSQSGLAMLNGWYIFF